MVKKPKSDAGKNISWPGATPYLARVSRQKPLGLRGSLPAMRNCLCCREFCFSRVSLQSVVTNSGWQICPVFSGNICHNSLAILATNSATRKGNLYAPA